MICGECQVNEDKSRCHLFGKQHADDCVSHNLSWFYRLFAFKLATVHFSSSKNLFNFAIGHTRVAEATFVLRFFGSRFLKFSIGHWACSRSECSLCVVLGIIAVWLVTFGHFHAFSVVKPFFRLISKDWQLWSNLKDLMYFDSDLACISLLQKLLWLLNWLAICVFFIYNQFCVSLLIVYTNWFDTNFSKRLYHSMFFVFSLFLSFQ